MAQPRLVFAYQSMHFRTTLYVYLGRARDIQQSTQTNEYCSPINMGIN